MTNVNIRYFSPPPQSTKPFPLRFDTPEKRTQKREKLKTADTLEDWGYPSSLHQISLTDKPKISNFQKKLQARKKHSIQAKLKVTFTYEDPEVNTLEVEIRQLKNVWQEMKLQQERLLILREENLQFYAQSQLQIQRACKLLKMSAETCGGELSDARGRLRGE